MSSYFLFWFYCLSIQSFILNLAATSKSESNMPLLLTMNISKWWRFFSNSSCLSSVYLLHKSFLFTLKSKHWWNVHPRTLYSTPPEDAAFFRVSFCCVYCRMSKTSVLIRNDFLVPPQPIIVSSRNGLYVGSFFINLIIVVIAMITISYWSRLISSIL